MCDINKKYREKLDEAEKGCINIINEMQKEIKGDNPFRVDDWFADEEITHKDIIFIFACPGKEEFINNKPCFGQTGKNLDIFIEHLEKYLSQFNKHRNEAVLRTFEKENRNSSEEIKDKIRYNYIILNSSDKVHFDGLGNGTLPSVTEINNKVALDLQIEKKKRILKKAKYMFCFGNEAQKYYDQIKKTLTLKAKYIKVCHLSNVALNIKFPNSHEDLKNIENADERKEKRIEFLFEEIKSQISKS